MRGLIILASLAATLAHAAMNDYVEVRDLVLDADGIDTLDIDTGAGPLVVSGDPQADRITVKATITAADMSEAKARERIEENLVLRLERKRGRAVLESHLDGGLFNWNDEIDVSLEVSMPQRLALTIEDGSGSIEVRDVAGAIGIDDGSGSIHVSNSGDAVDIDDGSGSIEVDGAGGDLRIVDGSGGIRIRGIAGSVYIDDGSGSIRVDDVLADLIVAESGSGSVEFANVQGRVVLDE